MGHTIKTVLYIFNRKCAYRLADRLTEGLLVPKMNPEIKERWLSALRGGEYKQAHHYLNVGNKRFCCLGVLTDLYVKDHPEDARWVKGRVGDNIRVVISNHPQRYIGETCLCAPVMEWAGIANSLGTFDNRKTTPRFFSLVSMNDGGKSFAEIANLIEEKF